jgi:hypothetical protein
MGVRDVAIKSEELPMMDPAEIAELSIMQEIE